MTNRVSIRGAASARGRMVVIDAEGSEDALVAHACAALELIV